MSTKPGITDCPGYNPIMPVTYRIDAEARLIWIKAVGDVTADDFIEMVADLGANYEWEYNHYLGLVDLTGVTVWNLSEAEVMEIAGNVTRTSNRMAVVGNGNCQAAAKLYAATTSLQLHAGITAVFSTIDEALRWLAEVQ